MAQGLPPLGMKGSAPFGRLTSTPIESTVHEWHSAGGAWGYQLKPPEGGLLAGDVPPDFKCGQGIPWLEESRVSIMGSGKDVGLPTGWDGSGAPLGTASIQRVGVMRAHSQLGRSVVFRSLVQCRTPGSNPMLPE